jgi:protein-disulfide isomerase
MRRDPLLIMSKREEMRKRRQQETRQRMLIIGGVIVVVAIAAAGWLIYQNTRPIGSFTAVATQTWPQADGTALGPKTAKVLVQEFADFQCPICGEYFRSVEPQIIKDYVASGKIRYEFHDFIVIDSNVGGSESRHAAEASQCANEQGHFWDYHNMLYSNQQGEGSGTFADRRLKAFAAGLGLDSAKFDACFDAHRYSSAVDADIALGNQMGVNGTPTVFLNGVMVDISVALNYTALQQKIDALVGQQ